MPEATHLEYICLIMHCMHYCTCTQKQQRFEKGMCHKVEEGCSKRTDSQGQHHISKLTDSRISQYALNSMLGKGNTCGKKGCKSTQPSNNAHHCWQLAEQEISTSYQIYTSYNHCSCVDESRHRSRTFHGIWQPYMQRELT